MARSGRPPLPLLQTRPARNILLALGRYEFLTVEQLTTLLYRPTSRTYVTDTLPELTRAHYTRMVYLNEPDTHGWAKGVWYLLEKGRSFVRSQGFATGATPHRDPYGYDKVPHHLDVASLGIALEKTAAAFPTRLELLELQTERYLQSVAPLMDVPVSIKGAKPISKRRSYAPDLLAIVEVDGVRQIMVIECDRGREDETQWQTKIAEIVAWTKEPYKRLFGTTPLGILVIATSNPAGSTAKRRTEILMHRTDQALKGLGAQKWASLFRFRPAEPRAYTRLSEPLDPRELYASDCWVRLDDPTPRPVIGGIA